MARGGARGLDDVVFPAVVVFEENAEDEIAEEGGDDGDVGAEAELHDDIGIRAADDGGDEHGAEDGADGEFFVFGGAEAGVGDVGFSDGCGGHRG